MPMACSGVPQPAPDGRVLSQDAAPGTSDMCRMSAPCAGMQKHEKFRERLCQMQRILLYL
jgi:hypothetical protein